MDDRRVGLIIRALRRRRGWRQSDLAALAGMSQQSISALERGHIDAGSIRLVRRALSALDAALEVEVRWRGGAIASLLDEDHATLVAIMATDLHSLGWIVKTEVTYAEFAERGSFDLLASHPKAGALVVVEVKTELDSAEGTLRKMDEKTRLAPKVARERYGWSARSVSQLLVLKESTRNRARLLRHAGLFDLALPARAPEIRRWLAQPMGRLDGRLLLRLTARSGDKRRAGGRDRVRCPLRRRVAGQSMVRVA